MIRRNSLLLLLLAAFSSALAFQEVPLSRKLNSQEDTQLAIAQDSIILGLKEYLGYVKRYHPVVKQANLILEEGQANLLKARGGFDPKIDVDYDRKEFKGTEYYDELYGTFKIPTWYGVEFRAAYERNEGSFLDPSLTVPDDGLYSVGASVQLLEGFLINDRMATLRQAKLFREQTQSERELLVNEALFDATDVYFDWWQAAQQRNLYQNILVNAKNRFEAIKKGVERGYKAPIDSIEARIAYRKRELGLQQANLDFIKARLKLSNFIWIDEFPVQLRDGTYPQNDLETDIDVALEIMGQALNMFNVDNHPKVLALQLKREQIDVDRRLKANKLLPKLSLSYDAISPEWNENYDLGEYKAGLTFSTPLFLRKERGDLQLARIKLQDAEFDILQTQLNIRNKVESNFIEINSYQDQTTLSTQIVTDSQAMLAAEERRFELGGSSLFLINSREQKLIENSLKRIEIIGKLLNAKASLFNSLAIVPENL
ncbi:MAG: TolC family protein [Nonlabens sp.]